MGIPKFFRWLSERYPLCSQLIQENRIPEFDNLYLDMNGIIHTCTHGNNDDAHFRITKEQQFSQIFHYIEFIFSKIKPRKLFFMAVDGVAPRAKINQQRSRRFRTAAEAAEKLKKVKDPESLPQEDPFDSNCITPGTEFMADLTQQLHYFIYKKISQDQEWRDCKVVLSGHEVPGEGEHKIMEYIRLARSQSDYDPNTRHCLYGLDADLIMLGLVTHDPHFCLLREEVVFGPQRKKRDSMMHPESQNFYLMHLSLLREYLDIEFSSLRDSLSFPYDLERVLDDFIVMAVFVGNDFLPHLPHLHINEGALSIMFQCYKSVLPQMKTYINDGGHIDMDALEMILTELAKKEKEIFFEEYSESILVGKRTTRRKSSYKRGIREIAVSELTHRQREIIEEIEVLVKNKGMKSISLPSNIDANEKAFAIRVATEIGLHAVITGEATHKSLFISKKLSSIPDEESEQSLEIDDGDSSDDEESQTAQMRIIERYKKLEVIDSDQIASNEQKLESAFQEQCEGYYKEKMRIDYKNEQEMDAIRGYYLQGIQWVMHYYYNGVQSWGWHYPYHYAPKINDLIPGAKKFYEKMPKFDIGKPFRPFEQLMGVMPVRSKYLLPEAYQSLMFDPSSPILDFYPLDFETDLNGKKNDWEAVIKIPFIDEKRLLQAMESREHMLTQADRKRNEFGNSWIFYLDPNMESRLIPSPLPGIFPSLPNCQVRADVYNLPVLETRDAFKKGLLNGVNLGKNALAGFPSLYTLDVVSYIAIHGVKVFQRESDKDSVVVTIIPSESLSLMKPMDIACKYLHKVVYVGWPFLMEAFVDSISDNMFVYSSDITTSIYGDNTVSLTPAQIKREPMTPPAADKWLQMAERLKENYSFRHAVLIGDVEIVFHVSILKGMKRLDNGALVKDFGKSEGNVDFPIQTVVFDLENVDTRYIEKPAPPIQEEFPLQTKGFYLGEGPLYGNYIEVSGYASSGKSLKINFFNSANMANQPIFGDLVSKQYYSAERYMPIYVVSRKLQVSNFVVSRITSSIFVSSAPENEEQNNRVDLGLKLKYEGKLLKVAGYTRKSMSRGWEFSDKAVELLSEYQTCFPDIFKMLSSHADYFTLEQCFPNAAGNSDLLKSKLQEVKQFIKDKTSDLALVPLDMDIMSNDYVREIEKYAKEYVKDGLTKASDKNNPQEMNGVPAHVILTPSQAPYRLSRYQNFKLGHRVVFVAEVGSVMCSSTGTVVGIERKGSSNSKKREENGHWIYVVFDEPFLGAGDLNGMCEDKRGLILGSECLLNLTEPQPPMHRRFVPSDYLKSQLIKVEMSAGVSEKGIEVYENKAGKRGLLSTLNSRPKTAANSVNQDKWTNGSRQRPMTGTASPRRKSADPRSSAREEDQMVSQIKAMLNINSSSSKPTYNDTESEDVKEVLQAPVVNRPTSSRSIKKPIKFVSEKETTPLVIPSKLSYTPTSVLQSISSAKSVESPSTNEEASQHLMSILTGNQSGNSSRPSTAPSLKYQPQSQRKSKP